MDIQNPSALLAEGPAELLDHSLEEYAAFLRKWEDLEEEHLEAVDYALCNTVVRLLVRAAGKEELEAAYEELRRLVPVPRETEWAEWVPRWRTLADLLEARLMALQTRNVEGALRLAHARRIVALVAEHPDLTQAEIGRRLELKPANLSRILAVLEAHELIERRTVGRERRVHPGRLASSVAGAVDRPAASAEAPPSEEDIRRGAAYLWAA
jgi:hypothetical protein